MTYFYRLIICLVATAAILTFIHYSDLDLKFQSLFFIFETKQWFVSRSDLILKFWFYRLPKYLIVIYGVSLIIWSIKLRIHSQDLDLQKKLLFLILALIITPLIVATLKHFSPVHCPDFINQFGNRGGRYISPLEIFDAEIFFNNFGKCSPAGHASGGFALISLYFVMPSIALRYSALALSLTLGWIMGLYQIAKGTHYLSDTIITLAIAYIVSISLQRILLKK